MDALRSVTISIKADTLCRRYEVLAKQAGIEVSISAALPKEPGVAGGDLAVILGNLWENAVAAALDADEGRRFIRLRVQAQEEQILIRMENGYGGMADFTYTPDTFTASVLLYTGK